MINFTKIHILFEETASCISIDLASMTVENWRFKESLRINYKTSDCCLLQFETSEQKFFDYTGYVPDFFPGQHFGDYIEMEFDASGKVLGWEVNEKDILNLI